MSLDFGISLFPGARTCVELQKGTYILGKHIGNRKTPYWSCVGVKVHHLCVEWIGDLGVIVFGSIAKSMFCLYTKGRKLYLYLYLKGIFFMTLDLVHILHYSPYFGASIAGIAQKLKISLISPMSNRS